MSELSFIGKLTKAMELSKAERVGMTLSYFDVVELLGELNSLKSYIAGLKTELTMKTGSVKACEARIDDLFNRLVKAEEENVRLTSLVDDLKMRVTVTEKERERQNALWGFYREQEREK